MLEGGIVESRVVIWRRRTLVRLPVTRQDGRIVLAAQEGPLVVLALESKEPTVNGETYLCISGATYWINDRAAVVN